MSRRRQLLGHPSGRLRDLPFLPDDVRRRMGPEITVDQLFAPGAVAPLQLLEASGDIAMTALAQSTVPRSEAVVVVADPREPCGQSVITWFYEKGLRVCLTEPAGELAKRRLELKARLAEKHTVFVGVLGLEAAKRIMGGQRNVNRLLDQVPPPGHVRAVCITQNRTATIHMIVRDPRAARRRRLTGRAPAPAASAAEAVQTARAAASEIRASPPSQERAVVRSTGLLHT